LQNDFRGKKSYVLDDEHFFHTTKTIRDAFILVLDKSEEQVKEELEPEKELPF
jgi:hypothetical protein